ncbi:unnamed protein product, partial [Phaeothamnion confervicola]
RRRLAVAGPGQLQLRQWRRLPAEAAAAVADGGGYAVGSGGGCWWMRQGPFRLVFSSGREGLCTIGGGTCHVDLGFVWNRLALSSATPAYCVSKATHGQQGQRQGGSSGDGGNRRGGTRLPTASRQLHGRGILAKGWGGAEHEERFA